MPEASPTPRNESTNWLTIFPTKNEQEKTLLEELHGTLGDFPDTQEIVLALSEALETRTLKGKKLSPSHLHFLQKAYDFISEGVQLGVDEAVSLRNRDITDRELKKNAPEVWSFYSGDYRGQMIGETEAERKKHPLMPSVTGDPKLMIDEKYVPHEQLGDTVHFIRKRLEQLLEKRRPEPVVLVDIGAMYGSTLLELADYFKNDILEGKLILIATNIGLNRQKMETKARPMNGTGFYRNYQELYQKAGQLVHFLQNDVEGLVGKELTLPAGQIYTLDPGTVDFVHENWSISKHSKTLERDVAFISSLVGKTGLIMSHQHDPVRGSGGLLASQKPEKVHMPSYFSITKLSRARPDDVEAQLAFETKNIHLSMLQQANRTLHNQGFKVIDRITDPQTKEKHQLNYAFWLGSDAEPLKVYKADGTEIIIRVPETKSGMWKKLKKILQATA